MKVGAAVLFFLGLAASLPAAQDQDKVGTSKAPVVLAKALKDFRKWKRVAVKEESHLIIREQDNASKFDGVMFGGDICAVKGSQKLYVRGTKVLVDVKGVIHDAAKAPPEAGVQAGRFKNPAHVVLETLRLLATARYGGGEEIPKTSTVIIDVGAAPRLLKAQLIQLGAKMDAMADARQRAAAARPPEPGQPKRPERGFGSVRLYNTKDLFDQKKSTSRYKIWVATKDLRIHRIEWVLSPVIKPNAIPRRPTPNPRPEQEGQGIKIASKVRVDFSRWDEDLPIELPREIKARLRIR